MDLNEPLDYNNKVSDQLPINTNPFSIAEIQVCLRRISNSQTPGPDYVLNLIWKSHHFQDQLLEFCNETFIGNRPTAFLESCIQPIPKKGKIRRPLLPCQRPADLRPTTMETTCPRKGNIPLTYPDTLARNTGLVLNEPAQAMANRPLWCHIVSAISTAVG